MKQTIEHIAVTTDGIGLIDISAKVTGVVESSGIKTGIVTLFCRHTSASLIIQENADRCARRHRGLVRASCA